MKPMIDFHSHILPGVDHGCSDIGEALRQLEIVRNAGVDTVVATPHFYPNAIDIESFLQKVDGSLAQLLAADITSIPTVHVGAEVLYCNSLEQMEGLERLCIRGTTLLLLELPLEPWNDALFYTVEVLLKRFTVVLAHIDRYARHQCQELSELLAMGAFAQINTASLLSFGMRRRLRSFLGSPSLVAIGSDLHGAKSELYGQFLSAQKYLGEEAGAILQRSHQLLKDAIPLQAIPK